MEPFALGYDLYLLSLLAVAAVAFFLSTVTRNSAASLVGALLFAGLLPPPGHHRLAQRPRDARMVPPAGV